MKESPNRPEIIAFAPALLVFVGIYTHVLLLLVVGGVFALAVYRSSKATRLWGSAALAVALVAGIALWHPSGLHVPLN